MKLPTKPRSPSESAAFQTSRKHNHTDMNGLEADYAATKRSKPTSPPAAKDELSHLNTDVLGRIFSHIEPADLPTLRAVRQAAQGLKEAVSATLPQAEVALAQHELEKFMEKFSMLKMHTALQEIIKHTRELHIHSYSNKMLASAAEYPLIHHVYKYKTVLEHAPQLHSLSISTYRLEDLLGYASSIKAMKDLRALSIFFLGSHKASLPLYIVACLEDILDHTSATTTININLASIELYDMLARRDNLIALPSPNDDAADWATSKAYLSALKSNPLVKKVYFAINDNIENNEPMNQFLEVTANLKSVETYSVSLRHGNDNNLAYIEKNFSNHNALKVLALEDVPLSSQTINTAAAFIRSARILPKVFISFEPTKTYLNRCSIEPLTKELAARSDITDLTIFTYGELFYSQKDVSDIATTLTSLSGLKRLRLSINIPQDARAAMADSLRSLTKLEHLAFTIYHNTPNEDHAVIGLRMPQDENLIWIAQALSGMIKLKEFNLFVCPSVSPNALMLVAMACYKLPHLELVEISAHESISRDILQGIKQLFSATGVDLQVSTLV